MSTLRAYIIVFLLFGALVLAAWELVRVSPKRAPNQSPAVTAVTAPPSREMMAYLTKSNGFQYLVSFTERGFEPITVSIKRGETVRFINNSNEDLWVASTGESGAIYPGTGHECGQSSFDTCKTLKKGDFWEFTFKNPGTWSFRDNFDPKKTGIVVVE